MNISGCFSYKKTYQALKKVLILENNSILVKPFKQELNLHGGQILLAKLLQVFKRTHFWFLLF